jgi:hypothetical protein
MTRNPDADDEAIFRIPSRKPKEASHSKGSQVYLVETSEVVPQQDMTAAVQRNTDDRMQPEAVLNGVVSAAAKPAPVHIEASVTISSAADEDEDNPVKDGDWPDFKPEDWIEGDDYPHYLYEAVPDGLSYRLRRRIDLEELPKRVETPKLKELRDRKEELDRQIDALRAELTKQ